MTTHFYTASSLDGFIATPEHSLEWLFKQDFDFEGPMAYPEFVKGIGALFMGASTYEWLLSNQDEWAEGRRYLGLEVLARCRFTLVPEISEEEVVTGLPLALSA